MKEKRYSEEQIVKILCEGREMGKVVELCRKHGISDAPVIRCQEVSKDTSNELYSQQ